MSPKSSASEKQETATQEKPVKVGKYYGRFVEADKKVAKENEIHLVGFIQETKNYDLFRFIEGNRDVNNAHLKNIVESMKEKYLISPIIVNEDFEIMDGQHRFTSCKELGAPILFIQIKGYGLDEIQRYNNNTRNWNSTNFMESYIKRGNRKYELYKTVLETFRFTHTETLVLLSGGKYGAKKELTIKFRQGNIEVIKDTEKIFTLGRMVQDFGKFYDRYKRPSFFMACMSMFKNKKYDHNTMVEKMARQTDRLQHCVTLEGYLRILEGIFNNHSREKVSFL